MGYYDDYLKKHQAETEATIKRKQDANTAASNKYVSDINTIVDTSTNNSVNKVQGEIDKLPTAFQSSFDANAVQQKINERQTAEHMANLGLTNSGLNRTQQTAFAIQRSNADAALRQQINATTASLKQQIADLYASGEAQKAENQAKARYELEQRNLSIYDTEMDKLYSGASAYEKAQIQAAAKAEEARIKAAQEKQERYEKWALENGYVYDANGNLVREGDEDGSDSYNRSGAYTKSVNLDYGAAYDYAIEQGVPENIASTKLLKRSEWVRSKQHGATYDEYVDWFVSQYGKNKNNITWTGATTVPKY